jgi:hypothetical protein
MHVVRHDHISADSDIEIAFSASNVFSKYLVRRLQITDFSAMNVQIVMKNNGQSYR